MAKNLSQIYSSNPSTTLGSSNLLYSVNFPYNASSDTAITYGNLLTQLQTQMLPLSGGTMTGNVTFNSSSSPIGLNFTGTSGNNQITITPNLSNALKITDSTYNYATYNSSAGRPRITSSVEFSTVSPITNTCGFNVPGNIYNSNASLSASQSGTTVTGSGTTFTAAMTGGLIYWPSTGAVAIIQTFNSTTSLTVDISQTQALAPFQIFYGGMNLDYGGIRQMQSQTNWLNNIDTPPSASGASTALAVGQTNATSVTIYKIANYAGTVTTSNIVNGSGTTNTSITSASTTVPFNVGQNSEVAFTTLNINGSVDSHVTTNSTVSVNAFSGFPGIQTLSANGAYIDYQTPNNLAVGVYKIEYYIFGGTARPIIDVTYKANGAGGYSNLRTGLDMYFPAVDGAPVQLVDYITVTTAGNPLNLRLTANGKNASSTGFFVTQGQIRITKIG